MEFKEALNQFIEQIGCTAKELAATAGVSPATLSRYRVGSTVPPRAQVEKIAAGLCAIAEEKGQKLDEAAVLHALFEGMEEEIDHEQFVTHLNALLSALEINTSDLARSLNFDPSYLSRIRSGNRRPRDVRGLRNAVCMYVVKRRGDKKEVIAALLERPEAEIETETACYEALAQWLTSGSMLKKEETVENFLEQLDSFNLEEYIRSIRFNELKVPTVPFQLAVTKRYYGLEEMKEAELDFLKSTVLSKSMDPVVIASDMPMEDMAQDIEFAKKWMFGLAMIIKKGMHMDVIHNIDRPLAEMLLGLQSWIPIYMTGQVSPYYLRGPVSNVYGHLNYVSGQAALEGECIRGHHGDGKYYLTRNKREVAYYRKKADHLLQKASPLMEIFTADHQNGLNAFLYRDLDAEGARTNILPAPPIYTMPEELLRGILGRAGTPEGEQEAIFEFIQKQRSAVEEILKYSTITDEIPVFSAEEMESHPMALSLSQIFYEKKLSYTYKEYQQHVASTQSFQAAHGNYTVRFNRETIFRNIQVQIKKGKWVLVSKHNAPSIHFLIWHPKMIDAFEKFAAPVMRLKS